MWIEWSDLRWSVLWSAEGGVKGEIEVQHGGGWRGELEREKEVRPSLK